MKRKLTLSYEEITTEQLDETDKTLVEQAKEAVEGSYAPYSDFHVGCAVRLIDGTIVKGANQENVSYPCGNCAERSALFYAETNYPNTILTDMAIIAKSKETFTEAPTAPCGLCRQALLEAEERQKRPLRILMCGKRKIWIVKSVKELLPFNFDAESIE